VDHLAAADADLAVERRDRRVVDRTNETMATV
jgi:hypothetical protein